MKTWDHYEYHIAGYYMAALINRDNSGLNLDEVGELETFIDNAYSNAREKGFTIGHWDADTEDSCNVRTCDVSGLYADVTTVRLMVWKET